MSDPATLRFYAKNASAYADHATEPTGAPLTAFLAALPAQARILELGCGNGRDAAHMLACGFDVEPTDGTPELAAEAQRRLGRPVGILRFEELEAFGRYHGIWACASLLHVEAAQLTAILARIRRALKPSGVFCASFKAGKGEGRDSLGRYYNYPSPGTLRASYGEAGWSDVAFVEQEGSGYDGKPTTWLWVTATRQP
ncbi:Methyltransferase domain-containing protein [Devosia crocina]|uniref:Methyltransferase domain-containing protein n=1 Tax=Devosia crocina TaxID=429728 RepID=A0A1I7NR04_9HYPH|nr:class I SAM-dependent methyltransferase [Devosia crocina]SFV37124.1 Methyltransferase domain-containing protein [Devosia crocina]